MKNKVEIKYVSSTSEVFGPDNGHWVLTVDSETVGKQVVNLPQSIALVVAIAVSTARQAGIKEGYKKCAEETVETKWRDTSTDKQYWDRKNLRLNDPRK